MSQVSLYREKNEEISEYINELNRVEADLITEMDSATTDEEINRIQSYINLIQETRGTLSSALGSLNYYYTSNLENSTNTLEQQSQAIAVVDQELQNAKDKLAYINKNKADKTRLVEVNQYYSGYYQERTKLLKWVIAAVFSFTIVAILMTRVTVIPKFVYNILIVILIAYFGYTILMILLSINARSKILYDEYDWSFNKETAPTLDTADLSGSVNPFEASPLGCVNELCCNEGTEWNEEKAVCMPTVSATTSRCSASPAT